MKLTVRLANASDAEALRMLNLAFNEVERTAEEIRAALQQNSETDVVAEADGNVVGFCCAQVHHSFCYAAPVAEITEMYVDGAHRRMGCASAMLRFAQAHLQKTYGVDECHLLTGCDNLAAQVAYEA